MLRVLWGLSPRYRGCLHPLPVLSSQSCKFFSMSLFNTSRLVGKTVLVTGASVGIGAVSSFLFVNS